MTILNIYNSYYKHIPWDVFNAAVESDPTSYNQGKIVKVGNFVKWILKLYTNGSWKPGDIFETKDLLSKFIKYKSKFPIENRDINRFNSVSELYSLIQTLEYDGVKSQKDVKKEGAEVVYEDTEWKIVIPHTEEASCIYGANTRWCTAGREHNMFEYYNKQGPLYININKQTGEKYQFHFDSGSLMDAEDKKTSLRKIGLSEGVKNYYKSIGKELYFIYDWVDKFKEGIAWVQIEDKGFNFINTKGELVWKEYKWFNTIYRFSDGIARVKLKDKGYNFIDTNGELLWSEYKNYDNVYEFSEGFACVYKKSRGWNYINRQGELLWKGDEWFGNVLNYHHGFAGVRLEGKGWNFINTQGELLWKGNKWFNDIFNFDNGFAIVKIEGKGYNYINTQCELVYKGDKWFDCACRFDPNGFTEVKYKGKWYKLNTKGELIEN